MVRRIGGSHLNFPDETWASWTPGNGIEPVAADLAQRLADGPDAQALVRRSIAALNADALRKGDMIIREAVWVPDRSTGEVMAVMDVTVLGFPPGAEVSAEAFATRNVKKELGRAAKLLDYAVDITDVPAGLAVVETMVLRMRGEHTVQAYLFFLVFPEDVREAFSLTFNTVHLNLLTEISAQARIIAESVVLTLGESAQERKPYR